MRIELIELRDLHPHPAQPPDRAPDEALVASVRQHGIYEPPLVAPRAAAEGGGYWILDGHRRIGALRQTGLPQSVNCQIRALSPDDQLDVVLLLNLERQNFDPVQEAELLARMGGDLQVVSRRANRSPEWVQLRLAIPELPMPARDALRTGAMRIEHVASIVSVPPELRAQAVQMVLAPVVQDDPLTPTQAQWAIEAAILRPRREKEAWAARAAELRALFPGCEPVDDPAAAEAQYWEPWGKLKKQYSSEPADIAEAIKNDLPCKIIPDKGSANGAAAVTNIEPLKALRAATGAAPATDDDEENAAPEKPWRSEEFFRADIADAYRRIEEFYLSDYAPEHRAAWLRQFGEECVEQSRNL